MTDDDVARAWDLVRKAGRDVEPRRHLRDLLLARGELLGEYLDIVLTPDDVVRAQNEADARAGAPLKTMRARHARADELLRVHGDTWFPREPWDKSRWKRDWSTFLGRGMPDSAAVFSFGPPQLEVLEWYAARFPLRRVAFHGVDPTEGLRFLDERGLFQTLGELDLGECTVTDDTIDLLARAAEGPLSLQVTKAKGLDGERGARLFGARAFRAVKNLGVASMPMDAPSLRALWDAKRPLDELRLYEVELPKGPLELPGRTEIEVLFIQAMPESSQLLEMVRALRLELLRALKLRVHGRLDGFFKLLRDRARKGSLDALVSLDLESNHVNDDEVRTLLEGPPPNLTELVLSQNSIGLRGMEALCAWAKTTTKLRRLAIGGNHIGSGQWEEGTDWDGTVVGSYERGLSVEEIAAKVGFPTGLKLY